MADVSQVFDAVPPFDAANVRLPLFYSRFGDVRLRDYTLRFQKDF